MGAKLINKNNDLALYVDTLPRQKRPSLIIKDQLGYEKVAAFLSDDAAQDFVHHLEQLLDVKVRRGNEQTD